MQRLTGLVLSLLATLFLFKTADAVVIDDFSVGPYDATVPLGIYLDPLTQTNLDPEHVTGGRRTIAFGTYGYSPPPGSSVHISIDPTTGVFESEADPGVTPVNLIVRYGPAIGSTDTNLKAGGTNALVFDFASADFGDSFFDNTGAFDIVLQSGSGPQQASSYVFAGVHDSTTPFSFVIPLSIFESRNPSLDLTHTTSVTFGTGNGNLFGTFSLDAVRTAFVQPGDFNVDGVVDGADYALWASHFGGHAFSAGDPADANFDGAVDAADYTIWRDNVQAAGAAAGNAAPEPSTWLLASFAIGLLLSHFKAYSARKQT